MPTDLLAAHERSGMTVEELIEALQKFFPGARVTISADYSNGWQPLTQASLFEDNDVVRIG